MHKNPFLLNLEPCLPCSWYLRFRVSQMHLFHTIIRTLGHFSLTLLSLPSVSLYHTSARLSFPKCTCLVPSSPFLNISWLLHICDMEPRFPESTRRACHDLSHDHWPFKMISSFPSGMPSQASCTFAHAVYPPPPPMSLLCLLCLAETHSSDSVQMSPSLTSPE